MYKKIARSLQELGISHSVDLDVRKAYSTDESIFEVLPQMIVTPKDATDVQKIVRVVSGYTKDTRDVSLTVRAAGTGLSGGSLNDSIILDTKNLSEIQEVQYSEGSEYASLQVAPGAYFRDVQAHAEKQGYFFPPFPSSWRICTIGGMVANNVAGPNSLKYGHTSEFVNALDVVMHDGVLHRFERISYDTLSEEMKREDSVGRLYRFIWGKLENDFELIQNAKPDSSKNSSGYELWDVLDASSVKSFKDGEGSINLIHIFCGSQGTIGIVTGIELSLLKVPETSDLLLVPIYDQSSMGETIQKLLAYGPYNIELYDDKSYRLALTNPRFFKSFFTQVGQQGTIGYVEFLYRMYSSFIFRLRRKIPIYTLLVKFDAQTKEEMNKEILDAYTKMKEEKILAHIVENDHEEEMFWRIRGSSFSLAKLTPEPNRPAAFLEDIVVSPKHISNFLSEVVAKLDEHKLTYAVHGHGGNGHFHFYPLFNFEDPETPEKLYKIAHEFYTLAEKHEGNICGEHNDGIMRTPFLKKVFTDDEIKLFQELEHAADPDDIFNPGKKVNPRFDIRGSIRKSN